jgi:hypothetical protein
MVPRSDGGPLGGTERTGRTGNAKTKGQAGKSQSQQKRLKIFIVNVSNRYILGFRIDPQKDKMMFINSNLGLLLPEKLGVEYRLPV